MATNLNKAQELIFGKDGLGASNFKMFPGSDRDATSEEISGQLAASARALLAGNLQEVTDLDDC